jgi:hypothetical protein
MRQSTVSNSGSVERSRAKVVSELTDFVSWKGSTRRLSSPRARAARAGPSSPSSRSGVERLQLADAGETARRELCRRRGTDAGQQAEGLRRQQGRGLGADDGEAPRLVPLGGEFGEQPVGAEADRDGHADLRLHPPREPGQHDGRRCAMQCLGAR